MEQTGTVADHAPDRRGKKRGRKLHYSSQQLLDIWLYVQVGMARTDLSALQFCKKRSYYWASSGQLLSPEQAKRGTGRVVISHMAHGETLRRRYQEAVAFLRAESEPYRRLWKMGVRSRVFGAVSPTEGWWQRELKARLTGG